MIAIGLGAYLALLATFVPDVRIIALPVLRMIAFVGVITISLYVPGAGISGFIAFIFGAQRHAQEEMIATQRGFQGGLAGTGMLPTCMNTWLVLTRKMCGIASIPLILIGIALASSRPESVPFILGMMLGVPLALALVVLLITAVAAPIVYNFGAPRRAQRAMADSAAATADPHQPLPTIERSQAPHERDS